MNFINLSIILFFATFNIFASERVDIFIKALETEKEIWPDYKLNEQTFLIADQDEEGNTKLLIRFSNQKIKEIEIPKEIELEINNYSYGLIQLSDVLVKKLNIENLGKKPIYYFSFIPSLNSNPKQTWNTANKIIDLLKTVNSPETLRVYCSLQEKKVLFKDSVMPSTIADQLGTFFHEAFHFIFQYSNGVKETKTWPKFAIGSSDDEIFHVCYDKNDYVRSLSRDEIAEVVKAFVETNKTLKKEHIKKYFEIKNERYKYLNANVKLEKPYENMDCESAENTLEFHEGWPQYLTYSIPMSQKLLDKEAISSSILLETEIELSRNSKLQNGERPTALYYYTGALNWILLEECLGSEIFKKELVNISQTPPDKSYSLWSSVKKSCLNL